LRGAASLAMTLAILAGLAVVWTAHARGPIGRGGGGSSAECEEARCVVAAAVAEACPCDGAVSHKEHVRCVSRAAKGLALIKELPTKCRKTMVRCAQKSSCGRAKGVACRVALRGGAERCSIKAPARCRGTVESGSCCARCSTTTSTTTTSTLPPGATTTTTASTSTTTTLIPCGGIYPVCLGSCPSGSVCTGNTLLGGCFCAASGS
jgi:hypothetical protein